MKPYTPHMQTSGTWEQHRFDTVTLQWDFSMPCAPWGILLLPLRRVFNPCTLLTLACGGCFVCFFKTCFEASIKTQKYRTIKNQHKFCLSQRPIYS